MSTLRENYLDGTEVGPGYCRAVRHGNTIFISGTGGLDENGVLPEGVEAQTRMTYKKIEKALAHFGADLSHIVRMCCYITDMDEAGTFSKVHAEVFADHTPANTLVAVSGLVAGMSVEIEVQAII